MNGGTRWVVSAFLAELDKVQLNDPMPFELQDRVLRLARMVAVDLIDDTDAEALALLELANQADQLCFDPTDPLVMLTYLAARQRLNEVRAAQLDAGG